MDREPTSIPELWDWLEKRFGFGTWDELTSGEAYWQWRMREIAKLKTSMKTRKTDVPQMWLIGRYCLVRGIAVRNFVDLYGYYGAARRWEEERKKVIQERTLSENLRKAQALEAGFDPNGEWLRRLLLASGSDRRLAYAEWVKARGALFFGGVRASTVSTRTARRRGG